MVFGDRSDQIIEWRYPQMLVVHPELELKVRGTNLGPLADPEQRKYAGIGRRRIAARAGLEQERSAGRDEPPCNQVGDLRAA